MSIISNIISMRLSTLFLLLATIATAHMSMVNPAPFRHAKNLYTSSIDYDYRSPLGTFPCKGYHKDLGTAQGKSVATYTPGQTYNIEYVPTLPISFLFSFSIFQAPNHW